MRQLLTETGKRAVGNSTVNVAPLFLPSLCATSVPLCISTSDLHARAVRGNMMEY